MQNEILYGLGALLLALAIGWAMWRVRTRNKSNDAITEAATRELRENPEGYDRGGRDRLNAQLKD
jgi:hypothetical protein